MHRKLWIKLNNCLCITAFLAGVVTWEGARGGWCFSGIPQAQLYQIDISQTKNLLQVSKFFDNDQASATKPCLERVKTIYKPLLHLTLVLP